MGGYDRPAMGRGADWQYTGKPKRARFSSDVNISSISTDNGTATVATESKHGLKKGDSFTIANASVSAYNGKYEVATSKNLEFTFRLDSSPSQATSGTIKIIENATVNFNVKTITSKITGRFANVDGSLISRKRYMAYQLKSGVKVVLVTGRRLTLMELLA